MNMKNQKILEEYKKTRDDFMELDEAVYNRLKSLLENQENRIMTIQHRLKTEESLSGKLERDNDRFGNLRDLTDILGARIICYFADDIDLIGQEIQELFLIDCERSSDRRQTIKADTFGYVSLHYICSLPTNQGYREDLCKIKFEIQIRTLLQHTWAEIEHDFGYKTSFGIPRKVRREFSRVAGLLEIADDEFVRIRLGVKEYTESIRKKIADNQASEIELDTISLREYVSLNMNMRQFIEEIAAITNAEIEEVTPDNYLEMLLWLKKETLGDLQKMLDENKNLALRLAEKALKGGEFDILSSSVGVWYLCKAELVNKGYTKEQMVEFFCISTKERKRAERMAERFLVQH